MSEDRSSERSRGWWERFTQSLRGNVEDQEGLLELIREASEREIIDAESARMIDGIFRIGEMTVRDVMIPRAQMEVIEIDRPVSEVIRRVVELGHSRYPVVGDDRDDVRGILLAKDLLRACQQGSTPTIEELLRPATYIPDSKHLDHLLYEFRTGRHHMALAVDEYGGVAGLITIEDVLEIIVGEIEDEYDIDEDVMIVPREDGDYLVNALIPLEDFNAAFAVRLEDDDADTLGGWVSRELGHVPRVGEKLRVQGLQLEVLRADRRRVQSFRLTAPSSAAGVTTVERDSDAEL